VRALFSHSYFMRFDPKQWRQGMPYPPLGTIYAAAVLREAGWEVALHDTMMAESAAGLAPLLAGFRPDLFVIYDDGFNYLTKMCLTNMREAAFEMSRMAKAAGARVIVCSSDSTDHFEAYLDHGADAVILGEGEAALAELAGKVQAGDMDWQGLLGLAFRREGKTVVTAKRAVIRDLDSLPAPAWDLVDVRPYQAAWRRHGRFSINMATTRGCPYKCNWCAKPIYGNRYNSHSPAAKAAELEWLVRHYGAQHIWFGDDIFGLKPGWVREFADELERRGLRIPFKIQSRADLLLEPETVAALARAGCEEVWLGAESGSQRILDAMDKGITVAQIKEARALLRQHGIRAAFFLQFGYLGETWEDIQATLDMLFETMPDDIGVSVSYPLPGTGFHEKVKAELVGKANWTDSDDLDLMFTNTYSPEFYKRLHRYIHKRFRLAQARERGSWKRLYFGPATVVARKRMLAELKPVS
jgi:anaerobic magnesium-protoporphyrin IX monomethyl ester cyclase